MKRYTLYLDEKLISEIKILAEDQKRSLSFMVSLLLQSAIREKQRKKGKIKLTNEKDIYSDSENKK